MLGFAVVKCNLAMVRYSKATQGHGSVMFLSATVELSRVKPWQRDAKSCDATARPGIAG